MNGEYIAIISLYTIHSLSFRALGSTHSYWAFIDPPNWGGSLWAFAPSYTDTHILYSSGSNRSYCQIPFECHERLVVSLYRNHVKLLISLEAGMKEVWRYTWRLKLCECGDTPCGHDQLKCQEYLKAVNLEVVNLKVVNLEVVNVEADNLEADNLVVVRLAAVHQEAVNL